MAAKRLDGSPERSEALSGQLVKTHVGGDEVGPRLAAALVILTDTRDSLGILQEQAGKYLDQKRNQEAGRGESGLH